MHPHSLSWYLESRFFSSLPLPVLHPLRAPPPLALRPARLTTLPAPHLARRRADGRRCTLRARLALRHAFFRR